MIDILVVIDVQNDFISGALRNEQACEIIPNIVNKIKTFNGLLLVTLDTHDVNYSNTQEGKLLPIPHCINRTFGHMLQADINKEIELHAYEIYTKSTFACVEMAQELMHNLYSHSKIRIELVGLLTDICIISNALLFKAFLPEAEIVVDASCCAGTTPENHKSAIAVMKSCQITIVNE